MNKLSTYIKLFLLLLAVMPLSAQQTYTIETVPNPKTANNSWVANPDGFLKPETVALLNGKIEAIARTNGAEVAIVVLNSIGSAVPADFATDLFNRWGIGKKESNNGLLILLVMDKRRVEFRTGYGLEAILPDGLCVQIQQQQMVPEFKKNDYDRGVVAGLDATAKILVGEEKWETTALPDELPLMDELLAKMLKKNNPKYYLIDADSLLSDTMALVANRIAKDFDDSLNLKVRMFVFADMKGVSPRKFAAYTIEKQIFKDSTGNFLHLVFDFGSRNADLEYQFSDAGNIFNEPTLMRYLKGVINTKKMEAASGEVIFWATWNELLSLAKGPEARAIAIDAQKLKETEQPIAPINYDYNNEGKAGHFWLTILKIYLWTLGALVLLTFIFLGIVQKIEDPYKKYHTLTFFALDIWIYLFPLPFLFLGRWVDKLRQQYRDAPRNDAKTGLPMTKLDEKEEDKFLKAGQITEEKINSIHYDVWATEDRRGMLVLPYPTLFSKYSRCSKCKTKAYYMVYNRTIRAATTSSSGLGEKKYECKHCGHVHQYTYTIPRKSESKSSSSGGGYSSSRSSGGSFGGGSSGGGGGGSSW